MLKKIISSSVFFILLSYCGPTHKNKQGTHMADNCSMPQAIFDCDGNKISDSDVNSSKVNWDMLTYNKYKKYNGIGRYGSCTGTLLDVGGSSDSPAYIITNGHCVGESLLDSEGVFYDTSSAGRVMKFNYFYDSGDIFQVKTKAVPYATMAGTDVALVELDTTYGYLTEEKGVSSFKLSDQAPTGHLPVMNIGVPLTGIKTPGLRRSYCYLESSVSVLEGPYHFDSSYPHQCSIVGGNSGSPALDDNLKIAALINTGSDDQVASYPDCSLNKPCEVVGSTKTSKADWNYAQPVYFLAKCFTADGRFDINLPECKAPK